MYVYAIVGFDVETGQILSDAPRGKMLVHCQPHKQTWKNIFPGTL